MKTIKTKNFRGKTIYQPTGKAAEYAKWACGFYVGCSNGCEYCYCKKGILAGTMGMNKPQLKKLKDENHAVHIQGALEGSSTPILRPISDLNKPLKDDTIPIVELAKICYVKAGYNAIFEKEKCYVVNSLGAKLYRFYFDTSHNSFYSMTLFVSSRWKEKSKYSEDRDVGVHNQVQLFDYLNQHHFDYRGLIEKGLAIDINTLNK